jgi:hypothetical protein
MSLMRENPRNEKQSLMKIKHVIMYLIPSSALHMIPFKSGPTSLFWSTAIAA